jgi:YrbI family 3-deoxy-D-manno-octulosonate 8-phosphate phosphatase
VERGSKIVAFIPVRGGSKSIPKKNIKLLAGKPLVFWAIDAAIQSGEFHEIVISTDDNDIRETVLSHPRASHLNVIERSKETSTDTASTESVMLEYSRVHEYSDITLIQATSPLVSPEDLRNAVSKYLSENKADSMLSVCRQKRFLWIETESDFIEPANYDYLNRPRRQVFDGFLVENGAFYITSKERLEKTGSRISGNITYYEMPEETYYELDEPADWIIINQLLNKRKKQDLEARSKKVKLFLTDVDGVLTDAGMYYSEKGDELKKFNTRDGRGIENLRKSGIEVGIITSEDTEIVSRRAEKLKVEILYQGAKNKIEVLKEILSIHHLEKDEIAYIGDDLNDMEIMKQVGFSACPQDAQEAVKEIADYVCNIKGGEGCVREFSDLILQSR